MHGPAHTARALAQYLQAWGAQPFSWAAANCCHLAAGWVQAATGCNPMQGLPETPDLRAALRLLQSLGGSVASAWTQRMGCAPISPATARVGDVVLMPLPTPAGQGTGSAVGICNGRLAVYTTTPGGVLQYHDMQLATHAWPLWGAR